MPPAPDNNPLENIDLDFTKPADKIGDLKEKIAAATRGIILAESINDIARSDEMAKKKAEFEATLAILEAGDVSKKAPVQEFWTDAEDAFSRAVGQEDNGALDRIDRKDRRAAGL